MQEIRKLIREAKIVLNESKVLVRETAQTVQRSRASRRAAERARAMPLKLAPAHKRWQAP